MRKAIIWNIAGPIHWRIYSALGGDVLNRRHNLSYMRLCTYPILDSYNQKQRWNWRRLSWQLALMYNTFRWYFKWGVFYTLKRKLFMTPWIINMRLNVCHEHQSACLPMMPVYSSNPAMASQITGVSIVCSPVCSGANQRKHQSSASLTFVRGIPWLAVVSLTNDQ